MSAYLCLACGSDARRCARSSRSWTRSLPSRSRRSLQSRSSLPPRSRTQLPALASLSLPSGGAYPWTPRTRSLRVPGTIREKSRTSCPQADYSSRLKTMIRITSTTRDISPFSITSSACTSYTSVHFPPKSLSSFFTYRPNRAAPHRPRATRSLYGCSLYCGKWRGPRKAV